MRQHFRLRGDPVRIEPRQRLGEPRVQQAAPVAHQALIGGVAQQRMVEGPALAAGKAAPLQHPGQFQMRQGGVQLPFRQFRDRLEQVARHGAPGHRRCLRHRLGRLRPVEPRHEAFPQAGRHLRLGLHRAVQDGARQFLRVERHAFRARRHQPADPPRQVRGIRGGAGHGLHQLHHVGLAQRPQFQQLDIAPGRRGGWGEGLARGEQEQAAARQAGQGAFEQFHGAGIEPVQVLHHQAERLPRRKAGELVEQRREGQAAEPARRHGGQGRRPCLRPVVADQQQLRQGGGALVDLRRLLAQPVPQLDQGIRPFLVRGQAGQGAQRRHQGVEGRVGVEGRGDEGQRGGADAVPPRRQEASQQARLADPGLAPQQHRPAGAGQHAFPGLLQPREIGQPVDEGVGAGEAPALAAALGLPPHQEGGAGLAEALQRLRAQVPHLEDRGQPGPGLAGDDDPAGRCQGLEPRREVGGGADGHAVARRVAMAQQVADHHLPRGDPGPGAQRLLPRRQVRQRHAQPPHRLHGLQRRADGAFRIVLMRGGKAEIGEHAVAQELRDAPVIARDRAGAGLAVALHDPHQVLGLQQLREAGGADQVEEQNRKRTALGAAAGASGSQRPAKLLAGADRQAELAQVRFAELRQIGQADPVLGEVRCVLGKAHRLQPPEHVIHAEHRP